MSLNVQTRQDLELESLINFYELNPHHFKTLSEIYHKKNKITFRIVDHFIVKYSKKYVTMYFTSDSEYFLVNSRYQDLLKGYKNGKTFIDAFRRNSSKSISSKFIFRLGEDEIETTIAQLNIFRWAFNHEVIDYIDKHFDKINDDLQKEGDIKKNKVKKNGEIIEVVEQPILQECSRKLGD
jgi:hypothetical protein